MKKEFYIKKAEPKTVFAAIIALVVLFAAVQKTYSDPFVSDEYGFSIDLPAGFECEQKDTDGTGLMFKYKMLPVTMIVKIYDTNRHTDCKNAISDTFERLHAKGDIANVKWCGADCAISSFTMQLSSGEKKQKGWAASSLLSARNKRIVVLCYSEEERINYCENAIISSIDSLSINKSALPGILTAFAYPACGRTDVPLNIDGVDIMTSIDKDDAEANKYVVEREYSLLMLYTRSERWKKAWQRYYRIIYKDACIRLENVSLDIYSTLFPLCVKLSPKNPDASYAQKLLSWVQGLPYSRNTNDADFTDLVSVVCGAKSDCDSRSLLLCVLLERIGIKSALFISREYSHAVAGLSIDAKGAKINIDGTNFLLAETTSHVALGMIAQEMSDSAKWIEVKLP